MQERIGINWKIGSGVPLSDLLASSISGNLINGRFVFPNCWGSGLILGFYFLAFLECLENSQAWSFLFSKTRWFYMKPELEFNFKVIWRLRIIRKTTILRCGRNAFPEKEGSKIWKKCWIFSMSGHSSLGTNPEQAQSAWPMNDIVTDDGSIWVWVLAVTINTTIKIN